MLVFFNMANENKHISDRGISVITYYEGCRLMAYWDSTGKVWTIGYGHTNGVYEGMTITQEQAIEFLKEDCLVAEGGIRRDVTRELTQYEFDALTSFMFNVGAYILVNDKTLKTYINEGNSEGVYNRLQEYVYSGGVVLPGLVKRRKTEGELYRDNDLSSIGGGSEPPVEPSEGEYKVIKKYIYMQEDSLFGRKFTSSTNKYKLVKIIGDMAIINDGKKDIKTYKKYLKKC